MHTKMLSAIWRLFSLRLNALKANSVSNDLSRLLTIFAWSTGGVIAGHRPGNCPVNTERWIAGFIMTGGLRRIEWVLVFQRKICFCVNAMSLNRVHLDVDTNRIHCLLLILMCKMCIQSQWMNHNYWDSANHKATPLKNQNHFLMNIA